MDDWAVGDLALCVRGGGPELTGTWRENGAEYDLAAGRVYVVDRIDIGKSHSLGLHFEAHDWAWFASRFRKIRPLTDEERESFLADLRVPVGA